MQRGPRCGSGASKVKAQVFTHLLYRHWNHYTGDKRSHLFLVSVENGAMRDLTPNDPHDVPPFSLGGGGGFAFAPDSKELAFTENLDAEPAISTNADIFYAGPDRCGGQAGEGFYFARRGFFAGLLARWEVDGVAVGGAGWYEADKFRLVLYDRAGKTIKDLLPKFENWVDEFAWAPNSKAIFYTSGQEGESPIFMTGIDGRNCLHREPKASLVTSILSTTVTLSWRHA